MSGEQTETGSAVVPAVGTPGSVATVRSLGRQGVDVIGVSERSTPPSFSSRYCSETVRVPSPQGDLSGYTDSLLALAARPDVAAIVPVREADIHVLANHRGAFAEHMRTPWPTFDRLQAVHDRTRLFAAAERADVPYPETEPFDSVTDWDRERIVKARHALLTPDTDGVETNGAESPPKTVFLEPGVEPAVDDLVDAMGHVPIAQAYLDGPEFCFRALCRDGEAMVTSQKRLRRGYKYARGPSIYHEAVDDPTLEATGRRLLAELDWTGLASVGFIRDEDAFKLLEVNPRIPASIPVDIQSGVDYPAHYWDLAHGRGVSQQPEYRPGTATHLLRGELVHLHSVLREEYHLAERPSIRRTVEEIGTSLVRQPHFDLWSRDDPGPFVRDTLNTIQGVFGRS